ncbi:hypothetical protein GCM10009552_18190 [Rothia nasimurium]
MSSDGRAQARSYMGRVASESADSPVGARLARDRFGSGWLTSSDGRAQARSYMGSTASESVESPVGVFQGVVFRACRVELGGRWVGVRLTENGAP